MIITCIYRLGEIACSTFCDEIDILLQKLFEKCDILLVIGDFNIWAENRRDNNVKNVKHIMKSFGLSQLVHEPTHILGHTLDLVFVNKYQLTAECSVMTELLDFTSDHYPVCFQIPYPFTSTEKKHVNMRNICNINMDLLKDDLLNSLNEVNYSVAFDELFLNFTNATKSVIDRHAPIISKVVNSNIKPAWMDAEYKHNRSRRRKLERIWKREKTHESRQTYIDQRKICADMAISKKHIYYRQLIKESSNNQRALFKIVNNMLDIGKNTRILPSYTNSFQLANEFNTYFVEKVNRIRASIPIYDNTSCAYVPFTGEKFTDFAEVDDDSILKIIKQHGIKTSPLDPIPLPILKRFIDEIIPYYTIIINRSLRDGSAEGFKISVVDPLLKNAQLDTEHNKSYRPVANLLFFSKLIERLVQNQLNDICSDMHCIKRHNLAIKSSIAPKLCFWGW